MDQPAPNSEPAAPAPQVAAAALIEDGLIVCPRCRFEYAHPVAVVINAGGSITTVDSGGTRMSAGKPVERGVLVEVHFRGECGHSYRMNFQFHKGHTMVDGNVEPGCGDRAEPTPTIWRD